MNTLDLHADVVILAQLRCRGIVADLRPLDCLGHAEAALLDIDAERSTLYSDMLFEALSEAARQALRHMNLPKYEYKTEFAKRYYGQGLSKGRLEGRTELVLRQLTRRFGDLPGSACTAVRAASLEELDRIGDRLLTASSLAEALG